MRARPQSTSTHEPLERRLMLALSVSGFVDTVVGGGGLEDPVAMDFAPDGRIFVTEQTGRVRIIKDGQTLATPFVEIDVNSSGERGLLGITLDPDFGNNQFVYVFYTATSPTPHNRVSRFTAAGDVAVPGSETVLLELDPLSDATNHNGGAIHFGPDGKLYVSQGENAAPSKSQSLDDRFGKILRINADGSIPSDNPFFNEATGDNRSIWATGLRNPFTFAFHPASGRMFINDVGSNQFEEINEGAAGANYGWPSQEGPPSSNPAFTPAEFFYGRQSGPSGQPVGFAITGGTFYDGPIETFPAEYADDYFFADVSARWIWKLDAATGSASEFATDLGGPVDLKIGPDGALYFVAHFSGEVRKISVDESAPPPPAADADPVGAILAPAEGRLFPAGRAIRFKGTATDAQDGRLAASAFTWRVDVIRNGGATETLMESRPGVRGGSFRIPRDDIGAAESIYRVQLTVVDSAGNTHTSSRDVHPNVVTITVNPSVPGLQASIDGELTAAPFTFQAVAGSRRALSARATQVVDGVTQAFRSWGGRRRAEFEFTVPRTDRAVELRYFPQTS